MGGYGAGQADSQWRSSAAASSTATAQGSAKRSWSGQVRGLKKSRLCFYGVNVEIYPIFVIHNLLQWLVSTRHLRNAQWIGFL